VHDHSFESHCNAAVGEKYMFCSLAYEYMMFSHGGDYKNNIVLRCDAMYSGKHL
jgi:hypothetical protein